MLAAAWRCHRGSALPRLHPLLHVQRSGIAVRCARSAQTAAAAAAAATAPNAGAPLGRMGRAAQRLADSDRSLAFLGRWALWIRRSRRTRLAIRAFRTAVLCAGIWNLGSQHGMMTYAADPEGEARKNLIRMVRGTVGDGSDKSRLVDQKAGIVLPKGHPVHDRAARITARVLSAAQQVIETKASAWEKKHGKWTPKDTANEGADRGNEAEEYLRYRKAYRNLKQRWNVVVLNDQGINAFVTDLCPRTIFVHAQIMAHTWSVNNGREQAEVAGMDDAELAFVLAHELSHTIYEHTLNQVQQNAMIAALQVVVISMLDPIGLSTLLVEFGIGTALKYGSELPMSREQETEADELGLEIMARACYDVRQATGFFTKLTSLQEAATGHGVSSADWSSTHPSHPKRIGNLRERMSSPEVTQHCKTCQVHKELAKASAGGSSKRGWFS